MSKARHPKPYNKGPRKQMTPAWKARVVEKLKENEAVGASPANLAELAAVLPKADKAGIYRTFNTPQMSSSYVDAICELLDISLPLVEAADDEELQRGIDLLRSMSRDARRDLMAIAERMVTKKS